MKQLQQALIEGGLAAYRNEKNVMLVSHRSRSITLKDILEIIYPEQLDDDLAFVEKDGLVNGFVMIYPRKRKEGNRRGPIATDRSKIVRPEIGPILDKRMQVAIDRFMDISKEARALEIVRWYEDQYQDQQEALERSTGE